MGTPATSFLVLWKMLRSVLRASAWSGHTGALSRTSAAQPAARLLAVSGSRLAIATSRPFSVRVEDEEGRRLYVGNLPWAMTADDVASNFEPYGEITNAHLPRDPEGRSRGFDFVTFASAEEASQACEEWDGREMGGRQIKVRIASPRPTPRHNEF